MISRQATQKYQEEDPREEKNLLEFLLMGMLQRKKVEKK